MTVAIAFLNASSAAADSAPINLAVTMLVIFGSAKLLAELFEKMNQPGIVGEILAGVLIGPSMLGWVSPGEFTITMAELGVMFLLFRVGLEVEPAELMKVGGTAVTVGILGVVIPFASGFLLFRAMGRTTLESVFLGTALTATSVGITAQVLSAKGLLHRTAARIILGAALVDDILALLLLGAASSFAEGRADLIQLGLTSLTALVFVFLIGKWGRSTMSAVMPRLDNSLQLGESQFTLAMVLLFGLAALSQKIGVAAIIGAFLAGMALSEALPHRVHDLAHGVTELLVPFFLANIGLHFSLDAFATRSTLLTALLLVPVAVFSKLAGCGLGASRFGRLVATRVGVGMIPRGEFCMVVAQVGLSLKAISPATYATIVFMAVVAAVLTPPLLKRAFRGVLAPPVGPEETFRLG
jgi:Kef-type K+ transport system membrane component KefB